MGRWLREMFDVPVVFVTSYSDDDTVERINAKFRARRCCRSRSILSVLPTPSPTGSRTRGLATSGSCAADSAEDSAEAKSSRSSSVRKLANTSRLPCEAIDSSLERPIRS